MTHAKLIPDDIREIITQELPSHWLVEESKKVNDYVKFGGIFDIGITPNREVHSILRLDNHKVDPTPEMREYLKSVYEKAIELSNTLYSKPQWVGSGEYNNYRILSVKPRVWKELVTPEHKDKVFDPRNYEVTIKATDHPRILDKINVYKQIFGKVKVLRFDGTEI
jgi:hypothetical protein